MATMRPWRMILFSSVPIAIVGGGALYLAHGSSGWVSASLLLAAVAFLGRAVLALRVRLTVSPSGLVVANYLRQESWAWGDVRAISTGTTTLPGVPGLLFSRVVVRGDDV